MNTKVQKWGNSQGVRFSKDILLKSDISLGDEVNIEVEDGYILIKPINNRKKYKLKDLLSDYDEDYTVSSTAQVIKEVNWGKQEGKEEW